MATIQFRRQLKFAHPKCEAIEYIKTRLEMSPGEPLICTYKEGNGKWGSIEVICVFPKGTIRSKYKFLTDVVRDEELFENGILKENILKINGDEPTWDEI